MIRRVEDKKENEAQNSASQGDQPNNSWKYPEAALRMKHPKESSMTSENTSAVDVELNPDADEKQKECPQKTFNWAKEQRQSFQKSTSAKNNKKTPDRKPPNTPKRSSKKSPIRRNEESKKHLTI